MTLKIIVTILLLAGIKWLYSSLPKHEETPEAPIDQAWWDGLSEEWKSILRINYYFNQHQVDFYKAQNDYLNRLRETEDADYTEWNTSLHQLNEKQQFMLSYTDLYKRVLKTFPDNLSDSFDLGNLHKLERIYMVSGPGDLRPLKKFPQLKVLIINYCGLDHTKAISDLELDLEPLRQLKQLEYLHCSTPTLKSLEPIKGLTHLIQLNCENSYVTSLAPIKNLHQLESLSFGSPVKNAGVITRLSHLKALYITGCQKIPDLSSLKKLTKLSIIENELALVNASYRVTDLDFLKNLTSLEFLDFDLTSYRGSLEKLKNLSKLKAITLPRVSTASMTAFKQDHPNCTIINAYEFE
jgi:hypothetical protein